jgi:AcrR family transcriptional regulator
MDDPVKTRRYSGERRRAQAARRRRRIIEAALQLFAQNGYSRTLVSDVARRADVAVDTVYASVGRKPQLLLAAHDLVLAEHAVDDEGTPVRAQQRRYVSEVRAAAGARDKIATYAAALGRLLPLTAPLSEALREAGVDDAECRTTWESVEQRRAANMRLFAADLRATGELREDLDDDAVADLVWSMNSPAYYAALARRGWSAERYAGLVCDVWTRTLLA